MTYSLNTLTDTGRLPASKQTGIGRFAHEFALVAGLAAIVFWLFALLSYSPFDAAFSTSGVMLGGVMVPGKPSPCPKVGPPEPLRPGIGGAEKRSPSRGV